MTRWKAAALHMLIGLVVLTAVVGSILLWWYPHKLYLIAGLDQLLITMLCVDLVAGPVLTCVVYKAGDRRTKWDLTVIGLLQAGFLGYALHTAWITRPVFLVWAIDHFVLVFANEIEPTKLLDGKTPETRSLSWIGPRQVAVVLPDDMKARERVFISLIQEQTSIERLPKYFGPYHVSRGRVLRDAPTVEEAAGPEASRDPRLARAIAATGRDPSQLRLVGIESTRDASSMLLDSVSAEPLEVLPLGSLRDDDEAWARKDPQTSR